MILVTGAAGLTGGETVRRLAARGIPVRALVRRSAGAEKLAALPGVEVVVADMGRAETLAAPLRGIERAMLISSSAPDMLDVQSAFIDAAAAAGVAHVVKLSGIMPERDSPFRFARMHGEIERKLERSGIPFTHLRAGEFMSAYFRQVPSIVAQGAFSVPMGDAATASFDIEDLAEIAVTALTGSGHEGKTYRLTGPHALSMTEVAAALSAATGNAIRYVPASPEEYERANLARGMPPYLAAALVELYAERRKGKEGTVFADAEMLLGRPATSFEAFALRNAAIFRGEQPAPKV